VLQAAGVSTEGRELANAATTCLRTAMLGEISTATVLGARLLERCSMRLVNET
jgi:hypothetical protein